MEPKDLDALRNKLHHEYYSAGVRGSAVFEGKIELFCFNSEARSKIPAKVDDIEIVVKMF